MDKLLAWWALSPPWGCFWPRVGLMRVDGRGSGRRPSAGLCWNLSPAAWKLCDAGTLCPSLKICALTKVKSESEVAQSCPTLWDPMDCSLSGSSVHGIFQARVLEWGAMLRVTANQTRQYLDAIIESNFQASPLQIMRL